MAVRITAEMADALRERIGSVMSPYRFAHTLGVEKTAIALSKLYCPDKTELLRAAALLHDLTKELDVAGHAEILREFGMSATRDQLSSPATLHSETAALLIPRDYPDYADAELIDAVRYHTTGREGMSLAEKLIYLADYIEETRQFESCVRLREAFFSAEPEKMSEDARREHLLRIMLASFDMTLEELIREGRNISALTVAARNGIIYEIKGEK